MQSSTVQLRCAFAVLLALLISGCAATRSTFDVTVPAAEAAPPKGFIKVTEVNDKRHFEGKPSEPSTPSLPDAKDLNNPAITSRAIARKRGGFGNAMADILLPEGRTVQQLVREVVTDAARQRGYAVVDEKSPKYGEAVPLRVDIQQFWSWFTPGFAAITLEFEGILVINGQVVIPTTEQTVRGSAAIESFAATDGEWQKVMQKGLANLIEKTKEKIKPAE